MEGNYDIIRGGENIGKAQVTKEGLYYRFRCCCTLTGEVIYRLTVTCGNMTENLGIPIPEGNAFRLDRKIPASRFSNGRFEIRAVPGNVEQEGFFAPVNPDEPFGYLAQLETARMARRGDQVGIVIPDQSIPLSSSSR